MNVTEERLNKFLRQWMATVKQLERITNWYEAWAEKEGLSAEEERE